MLPTAAPTTFADGTPKIRVVIACTFDPLGLQGPLQVWLRRLTGLPAEVAWIGYGMVLDAIQDTTSAWGTNASGVNVLMLRWCDLVRSTTGEPAQQTSDQAVDDQAVALIAALDGSCGRRKGPTVVLLPPASSAAADDSADERRAALLHGLAGVNVIHTPRLRASLGGLRFHSPFLDRVAHAPYSPAGCSVLAGAICRALAGAKAAKRKAFLLDCDNTLWGGAVGELGPLGVSLSEPFVDVQARFVARQRAGALLCLVSRNEERDVRAVLAERADELTLTAEHVVAIRASWGRKSDAVLELATTLCLDPSSFVFVDDSPAECADVTARAFTRGVGVVHVPRDPARISRYLDCNWALDEDGPSHAEAKPGAEVGASAKLTEEDRTRTALYRQLDERKSFVAASSATAAAASSSVDAFVASFNLRVHIAQIDEESAGRAAQLTERTNQHNACKWQISAPRLLGATAGRTCLTVDASDRFGHHGLIGLIVADAYPAAADAISVASGVDARGTTTSGDSGGIQRLADVSDGATPPAKPPSHMAVLHIRCWLLSCRSLHLGLEHMMLRHVAAIAAERGATHLGVHWVRAERNEPAAAFLFSLPGVSFVPVRDASALGLQPLEGALMARDEEPPVGDSCGASPSAVAVAGTPEAATDAAFPTAAIDPTPLLLPVGATSGEVANVIEDYTRSAIAAGRKLQLASLPTTDALASHLPPVERKMLARRLSAIAGKARNGEWSSGSARAEMSLLIRGRIGGELCRHTLGGVPCTRVVCPFVHPPGMRTPAPTATAVSSPAAEVPSTAPLAAATKHRDPTYGQISQYRKDAVRPEAGVIVIPLEAAAAAAVSFTPLTAPGGAPGGVAGGVMEAVGAHAVGNQPAEMPRVGFSSKSVLGLHPETIHSIADALSQPDGGRALHEWVAAESAATHKLPDAFAEVWQLYEQRGAQFERALGEAPAHTPPPLDASAETRVAAEGPSTIADGDAAPMAEDLATLDVEALHARLRRMMRHSMHVMIQEANPESYYKDVMHVKPT